MNEQLQTLLEQKISDLPFSAELKSVISIQGFETLEDLLKLEVFKWHKEFPGFNYHHQHEVVSYVMKNNLGRFLKDK